MPLLHEELPHDADALLTLKLGNAHFCNLAGRYHALGRAMARAESECGKSGERHRQWLRQKRVQLLDEIALMLEQAECEVQAA